MTRTFNLIARITDYAPKKYRGGLRAIVDKLPEDVDVYEEMDLLKASCPNPSLFLLGDATIHLSPYGAGFSFFLLDLPDGRRRRHTNELMHGGFEPTCEKLRDFFLGLEAMIRYGAAIKGIIKPPKTRSTETLSRKEVEAFCKACDADSVIPLVHLLIDARNSFSHLLQSCDRIRYNDEPLELCFSKGHFHRNADRYEVDEAEMQNMRFFEEDAFTAAEALITAYRTFQHEQLDAKALSENVRSFVRDSDAQ